MLARIRNFINTTMVGGLAVVLPVAILTFVIIWLMDFVKKIIQPVANLLSFKTGLEGIVADALAFVIVVVSFFVIGVFVKTSLGRWFHRTMEDKVFAKIPGYKLIKETISQFLNKKKSPFSQVALVKLFGNDTLMTAFVTDETDNTYTVFVPTGPNPTSGLIYHVPKDQVQITNASVDDAMRSIISCGAGSADLMGQEIKEQT